MFIVTAALLCLNIEHVLLDKIDERVPFIEKVLEIGSHSTVQFVVPDTTVRLTVDTKDWESVELT